MGLEPAEVVGASILEFVHPRDRRLMSGLMMQLIDSENGATERSGWRMRRASGTWVDVEVVATNLINELQIGGVLLNCRDISASKAFEEQLRHRAFHDQLTQLPNRALLLDRTEQAIARENRALGLLFVDIDDFKVVNDTSAMPRETPCSRGWRGGFAAAFAQPTRPHAWAATSSRS